MILLDYKDRRPIYEQVAERLQEMIMRGILEQNSQLPSVRSLATELSINPNTIQRAYMELERKGFVYSIKGKGNFVSDNKESKENWRKEIFEELEVVILHARCIGIHKEELREKLDQIYERGGE